MDLSTWLRRALQMACRLAIGSALASGGLLWGQSRFEAEIVEVLPSESGIDFKHTDGASGQRYIVETVLGALALFDYDGDGFIDLYFVNGAALRGSNLASKPRNRLYRNHGDWTFTDVTDESGLGDGQYGMGVVVGDYDQDGDPDVFLSNFGKDTFYINQGDGTFTESAERCGFSAAPRFGAGNSFFDLEGDGDLDLYCASYVEFDYADHKVRTIAGYQFHTGPNDYAPAADLLYRNEGDGTFTDISLSSGVGRLKSPGMGVLAADFDQDGQVDLFVANDQQPNYLLMNDGQGRFEDMGLISGVAFDRFGHANGNMGVEYADLDGDGLLDLISTTYQEEMPVYYQAIEPGLYSDSTNIARIDPTLLAHVNWGIGAVDFDNDGDRDLFLACGHFLDNIRFIDDRTDVKVSNYLLANDGRGRFTNVSSSAGSAVRKIESSRAAGFDDLDNDGDVDLVVLNANASPTIGRTELKGEENGSVVVTLVGTRSNRDALGSRVVAIADSGPPQVQATFSGRGYESYYGRRLVFGLGKSKAVTLEVTWPDGQVEIFKCTHPTMTLVEGHGRTKPDS